jgi:hypothetical protein
MFLNARDSFKRPHSLRKMHVGFRVRAATVLARGEAAYVDFRTA